MRRSRPSAGTIAYALLISCSATFQAQAAADLIDRPLEELTNTGLSTPPKDVTVTTTSKYAQASSRAPSALRLVTAEDIRTFGYRTLAEILRSLPGVYVTDDRNYSYVGVRGFGRPGDYNARVLLIIDGQRMNENVFDSAAIGNDFAVDVDLIERVEFSPGPGSAIYGNNAFFGVINVITKRGNDFKGAEFAGSYGGFDTFKGRGTYGQRFDNGAEVLLSATAFDRDGPQRLYYPQYDTPDQNHGVAEGLDYDRNQSTFGKFSWHGFTLEGGFNDRKKGIPTASSNQRFNDSGSFTDDQSVFVGLTFSDQIAADWNLYLRLNYNQYDYHGDFIYDDPAPRTINRDAAFGRWWGGEFRLTNTSFANHKLLFGMELQDNLDQNQEVFVPGGPVILNQPYESTRYGVYLQDEYQLLDNLTLVAGARYDYNPLGGGSANPRIALIWQALDTTTLKLIYGTAFRAPNVFERFYSDGVAYKANPRSRPEDVETLELVAEHFIRPSTRISASAYHYHIAGLINQVIDPADGFIQYQNQGSVSAHGIELDAEQRFLDNVRLNLSYVWQQAHERDGRQLTNSPQHQVKLNVSAPLWSDKWRAGFQTIYLAPRFTKGDKVNDYVIGNFNVSGEITKNLSVSAGIYNLWDSRFADPVSEDLRQDSIVQDGRDFRLKLNLRY